MKFLLSWLRDHLSTDASLDEIAAALTRIGLEVDSVSHTGAGLEAMVAAHVTAVAPHPDADRLRVCTVDSGDGQRHQVVCGAPNVRAGMKGVFAPPGTTIPGTGVTLKTTTIRGVESRGMLLSERELGLGDDHDGIVELPGHARPGALAADVLGLKDPLIEIELTPNRPDCAGIRGIARDLAAAGLGEFRPLGAAMAVPGTFDSPVNWRIAADGNACGHVAGRYFRDVRNGPSPAWMQQRLRAVGLRPISALVDITNYVTLDLGRPLHVFDAARLQGDVLTMRQARPGESIAALDGRTHDLAPPMTVIADAQAVHGIAGIMGGVEAGCTADTTTVFLECAWFRPVDVADTGRALNLLSDARYRFERGVDPASVAWGVEVAARLILDLCGGSASHVVCAGAALPPPPPVTLRTGRCASLAGLDLPAAGQRDILDRLGFLVSPAGPDRLTVTAPGWRPDIQGEADLVEEIVRIHGLEHVRPVSMPAPTAVPGPAIDPARRRAGRVRRSLAARGLSEAVTWSFTGSTLAALFGGAPDRLKLRNPISSALDVMRPSPLPNLVLAAQRNADRGHGDVALFELGPGYRDDTPAGQVRLAAGVRLGLAAPLHWSGPPEPVDAWIAKGDALAALTAAAAPVDKVQATTDAPDWYHPGQSGVLRLGARCLAHFGLLHPGLLAARDLPGPMAAFEVFLDAIPHARKRGTARPPLHLPPLQPVRRDFAFVVRADVTAAALLRAVRTADRTMIADAVLFDLYTGGDVAVGHKSVAIRVTLQPRDATLTHDAMAAIADTIVARVEKTVGGHLRTRDQPRPPHTGKPAKPPAPEQATEQHAG